jgi:hypothetical protein
VIKHQPKEFPKATGHEDRYQSWAGPPLYPGKAATPDREESMAVGVASTKSGTTAATIEFRLRAATKLAR